LLSACGQRSIIQFQVVLMKSTRIAGALALVFLSFVSSLRAQEPAHAVELEEVVVTASPIGDPDRLATIGGSVDRDQLLRSGGNTIADALSQLPGVTSSGFAAGAGRPVIRGMDANRVRTLEDGIGSFDVSDVGPDHGVPLDPFAAERVEVVRGAATLRYGSQAIGGVVNAISNRVPLHLMEGVSGGEVSGSFGTGADSRDVSGQFNSRSGDWAMHADAFSRHSSDYDTPDGAMSNSWLRGEGGALGGAWIGADERVGLGVVRHESRYGIPGEDAFIDMQQTKLSLRSSFNLSAGAWRQLTVDAGGADYEHSERDAAGVAQSTFKDREWDVRAEAVAGPWHFLSESALGMQLQQRNFSALGEGQQYLFPTRTRSQAVFGFAESRLSDPLRLQFGARVEHVSVDGTPASDVPVTRSVTPISASAGLVFDAGEPWRLGLALSSAARAPAQTELFARGMHEATATYETGQSSLRAERANSAELSLRWRGERLHADGAVWVTDFNHFIYGELTGRTCSEEGDCITGEGEELTELLYTQRGALFRGVEGHAEIELLQHAGGDLHLNLLADAVRATLDGSAGNVPRIPGYRVGAGLAWQGAAFDANVFVKYNGRQSDVAAQETPTSGFFNVDAQLAWRPWTQHPGIELALTGRNLTNTLQRNAVSLNKDEVVLPGRDLRLVFRVAVE
jgi:iron complex outermembrane recepter protein